MAEHQGYQTIPLSPARRMQVDGVRMAAIPGAIHGLIEVDVTRARQIIREHQARTGERLSFTAFAIACLARAVAENPRVYAAVARSPHLRKKALCTVAMSSVGMFGGPGSGSVGGWGIPISHHTLAITLGGIGCRQVLVDGAPQDREFLCVTVSLDHAIVDGAPAARFAARFRELLESAQGLEEGA